MSSKYNREEKTLLVELHVHDSSSGGTWEFILTFFNLRICTKFHLQIVYNESTSISSYDPSETQAAQVLFH